MHLPRLHPFPPECPQASQLLLGGGKHVLTPATILLIIDHAHAGCAEGRDTVVAEQMVPKQPPQMLSKPIGKVQIFGSPPLRGRMEPQGGDTHHTCAGCSQATCSSFSLTNSKTNITRYSQAEGFARRDLC